MTKLEKRIVFSASEPSREALWLHYKEKSLTLDFYGDNGWEPISANSALSAEYFDSFEEFDSSTLYSIGDIVKRDGLLYKFTAEHSGEWDNSDVEKTTLMDVILETPSSSSNIVSITYAELKALRDNTQLVPGMQYRITDYHCTTIQENTKSADHQFDIIVVADDESTLNENARAIVHEGDTYFSDANLAAWELKYCLDNDTDRFAWAKPQEDMVITNDEAYYRRCPSEDQDGEYAYAFADCWGNGSYDFIEGGEVIYTKSPTPEVGDVTFHPELVGSEYEPYSSVFSIVRTGGEGKGVVYYMKDEWNNECPYDFKNIQFKRKLADGEYYPNIGTETWVYTFHAYDIENNIHEDAWRAIGKAVGYDCNVCFGNVIKPYCYAYERGSDSLCYRLNDIVFLNTYEDEGGVYFGCYSNIFGNDCYENTFGNYCFTNTLGTDCYNNIFGTYCYDNIFGNDCCDNIFGTFCYGNTLGALCYQNTFGDNCLSNTLGEGCEHNTFGDECTGNTFGTYCYENTFCNYCCNKHLDYTSEKTSGIGGDIPEFWFNNEKKW